MRRHGSVFLLYVKQVIWPLVLIAAAMAAVELLGFYLALMPRCGYFGAQWNEVFFGVLFLAANLALMGFCIGSNRRSNSGYTIARLRISEGAVYLWQALADALAFLILWEVQVLTLLAAAELYRRGPGAGSGAQGIVVELYRTGFYHGLIPLKDSLLWLRNGIAVAVIGCACASASLAQRWKKKSAADVMVIVYVLWSMSTRLNGAGAGLKLAIVVVLGLVCIGVAVYKIWERGAEDDEETA